MAEPVNLNKVRKDKARAAKRVRADANAVKFGRTKAERSSDEAAKLVQARRLDGHQREPE